MAVDALSGLTDGAGSAASNFIAGLVGGIQAGIGSVIAAVSGLASGALAAFTGALGIKSPSTIMLEHGKDNIAGAAATGIDKGAPKVDKAMAGLGGGPKGKGGGKGASGGGGSYEGMFTNCTFYETTPAKARQVWEMVLEQQGKGGPVAETT
jgi:hypothetical protein